MLYELGLAAALKWLTEHFDANYPLSCGFSTTGGQPSLSKDVEIFLFQAARELLLNVAKHASASRASVELVESAGYLSLSVYDDGVGLDVEAVDGLPSETQGFGLFNIRERLRLIDGELQIESQAGTQVRLQVPLPPQ